MIEKSRRPSVRTRSCSFPIAFPHKRKTVGPCASGFAAALLWLPMALHALDDAELEIGYESVTAAYKNLTDMPDASIERINGWTIVEIGASGKQGHTTWSFVPVRHPAYPALVRRDAVLSHGEPAVATRLLCESSRPACDALFDSVDEQLPIAASPAFGE